VDVPLYCNPPARQLGPATRFPSSGTLLPYGSWCS